MWCKHQLGELAENLEAFRARGVAVAAISVDETEESPPFAARYGITYPLLSDEGGEVSRAYVGLDAADVTVPGVVIVARNGRVVFRQLATGKDDRLTAAQLLAAVDTHLGTGAGAPIARRGYAPLERWQLRVDLGGGRLADGDQYTASATIAARYPLARFLAVGAAARYAAFAAPFEGHLTATLRLPILADAAAIELTGLAGYGDAWTAGARLGAWVALDPRWGLQLEVGGTRTDFTATFGVSRLFERR